MVKLNSVILAGLLTISGTALAEEAGFSVTSDIPFGDLPRQVLDIYSPEMVSSDTPVLVFLYGGGFSNGNKTQIRWIARSFVQSGVIVVTPNYRLYPEVTFPAFIEDTAMAVSYVWRNLRNGADIPRPIILGGWSAGAYISAMVAYDGRYLEAVGTPPRAVTGFIGLAGPYWGGLCAGERCPHIFPEGTEANWPVARFVDASDPPMLLVRGTHDIFVDIGNLETLAAAGEAAGIDVTTVVVKDGFHEQMMSDIKEPGTEVHEATDAFLMRVLAD
jgi:acetyl esterase/lipase